MDDEEELDFSDDDYYTEPDSNEDDTYLRKYGYITEDYEE